MPFLSWFNRDADLTSAARTPYRLLEPVGALSYGEPDSPNMLIEGDNLDALKALLPYYAGQVKCVFIDPPYNTKSAFEQYDDNLEHSQWLSIMYPRLELLRELLADDGSLWVTMDDNEAHYFKVVCDEVFGRKQFVANAIWRSSDNSNNDAKTFSVDHNHLFVFSKAAGWLPNKIESVEDKRSHFKNPDNDPKGPWFDGNPLNSPKPRQNLKYNLTAPNGTVILHPKNGWRWEPETMQAKIASGEIRFNKDMTGIRRRTYLADMKGLPPSTLWTELHRTGHNRQAKAEQKALVMSQALELFTTPKPERLMAEIIHIATNPGDLVLDSFLGSGTTAAVAHKMGRRWIGIEMGEHARTHCQPRLKKVIEGEQGGISGAVGWKGGGGFRYYKLGVPVFDESGHIRESIRFEHLAAHIWFAETGTARSSRARKDSFLGEHGGIAYYLLFNGILGDTSKSGGNVLTRRVLRSLPRFEGPKVIYGEACALPDERLHELDIAFRQTPYDIKAR